MLADFYSAAAPKRNQTCIIDTGSEMQTTRRPIILRYVRTLTLPPSNPRSHHASPRSYWRCQQEFAAVSEQINSSTTYPDLATKHIFAGPTICCAWVCLESPDANRLIITSVRITSCSSILRISKIYSRRGTSLNSVRS